MNNRGILHTALISWALLIGYSSGCSSPAWFGSSCQYQCRCANNNCDTDGQCTNDAGCVKGWFGPACQYVDLAYYGTASNNVLKDGNDNTCIQQTSPDRTTFTLNDSYTFTWLRVHTSKPDFLHDLTVTFNSTISCTNSMSANVDDTTLDIYCELKERVQSVTLTGKGVQYICSVYISGGRNVALKQNATQSTTLTWQNKIHPAESAVDGDRTRDLDSGNNCSCTDGTKPNPNWTVWFSNPQSAHRYIIYNRDGAAGERLKGFTLESFDAYDSRLFNYTDRQSSYQSVYTIFAGSVTLPISHVTIQVSNGDNILMLCEVEVYGDSVCDSGYYGRECEHKCNCARNEACFVSTGRCPSGCADGFQGENCNEICDAGKYGQKCSFNCSQFCQLPPNGSQVSSCDHVDGACRHGCQPGYEGKYCLPEQAVIMAGTVAGICVAVAVVLIITIILVVVVCRRRFRTQSPYDRPDNTQQDNYPYTQPGRSGDGYELSREEISRMRSRPHNLDENNGKHGRTREVPPDSSKVQQDFEGGASNETDKHVYEELHDDDNNSGGHTSVIYNNI